jgi:hydrogenase maturation factor HypF (carbamoyltransferase family)
MASASGDDGGVAKNDNVLTKLANKFTINNLLVNFVLKINDSEISIGQAFPFFRN